MTRASQRVELLAKSNSRVPEKSDLYSYEYFWIQVTNQKVCAKSIRGLIKVEFFGLV